MVKLMEWWSGSMILPHVFCDGVKRAHGCNKCSQAFSRLAHHSFGSSCQLQIARLLHTVHKGNGWASTSDETGPQL